jgi:hypothetical protein
VVAAGPLYRGRVLHGERITWLAGGGAADLMNGLDLAVCAAGYNTFFELMHAGVPAVFLPQDKVADEQHARAERAVRAGAAVLAQGDAGPATQASVAAIREAVGRWRDDDARAAASAAARALVPKNHARDLAADLLRLVLPAAQVDAAEEAVDDGLLGAAHELGLQLDPFLELARCLAPEEQGGVDDAGRAMHLAVDLLRFVAARGIPVSAVVRVAAALTRKLPMGTVDERAAACRSLIEELAVFDDWAGAATLMKVFGVERRLSATGFAGELAAFLAALRGRGEDLYRGIAYLSGAQGVGAELPTNQELLRAASRGWS